MTFDYYITDHYQDYTWMLVRLSRVHPDAMRDLLQVAWRLAADLAKWDRRSLERSTRSAE